MTQKRSLLLALDGLTETIDLPPQNPKVSRNSENLCFIHVHLGIGCNWLPGIKRSTKNQLVGYPWCKYKQKCFILDKNSNVKDHLKKHKKNLNVRI